MKKILILILTSCLLSASYIKADEQYNIYERFIKVETYETLNDNSIWKQDDSYKTKLLNSLNSKEPIMIIEINKE